MDRRHLVNAVDAHGFVWLSDDGPERYRSWLATRDAIERMIGIGAYAWDYERWWPGETWRAWRDPQPVLT